MDAVQRQEASRQVYDAVVNGGVCEQPTAPKFVANPLAGD
jgi:hypothetical protein